jgi:hypothetical protein
MFPQILSKTSSPHGDGNLRAWVARHSEDVPNTRDIPVYGGLDTFLPPICGGLREETK